MLAVKVIQRYRLEYHHQQVGVATGFVNKPDCRIRLKFIPRVS